MVLLVTWQKTSQCVKQLLILVRYKNLIIRGLVQRLIFKTFSCPLVRYFHTLFRDDLTIIYSFFLSVESKKENKLLWNFFDKNMQPFLSLNLSQNKFHKKLRKIIINFYRKFSWHRPKLTAEINIQKRHEKVYEVQEFCPGTLIHKS